MYFIKVNSIDAFCNSVFSNNDFNHCHITTFKTNQQKNKVILGRIFKVFPYSEDLERYLLLVTEYQPNNQYGQILKVAINGKAAKTLNSFSPQRGDKIAFLNPFYCKNPSYKVTKLRNRISHNQPRHFLEVNQKSVIWFAQQKNQSQSLISVKEKSKGGKPENKMSTNKNSCEAEKSRKQVVDNDQPSDVNQSSEAKKSRKEVEDDVQPQCSGINQPSEAEKSKKQAVNNIQPNPAVQLQKNPSTIVKPAYRYKSIYFIHEADMEMSVNLIAVVQEITKPVRPTNKKYMMKVILVDDSEKEGAELKFSFFFPVDGLMRRIEVGDVLRLHRVKLEHFHGEIDGRVFFEHDVVIFKSSWPAVAPITPAKTTMITDDDEKHVTRLLNWFNARPKHVVLSEIKEEGTYHVTVRTMMKPERKDDKVIMAITDGSMHELKPYPYTGGEDDNIERAWGSTVAELVAHRNLDSFTDLPQRCYLHLFNVDAVKDEEGRLCLHLDSKKPFKILYRKSDQAVEIKKLIFGIFNPDGEVTFDSSSTSGQESERQKSPQNNQSSTNASTSNHKSRRVHTDNASTSGDERLPSTIQKTQEASLGNQTPTTVNVGASTSLQENSPSNKKSQTTSPAKSLSKLNNGDQISCVFGTKALSNVNDNDGKITECDRVTKSRKQLFTPNYTTDLSEAATDETSELNEETSMQPKLKAAVGNVLLPANTSLKDIVKICSSMQQDQPKGTSSEQPKQMVVMLERIPEEGLLSTSQKRLAESKTSDNVDLETAGNTGKKRRMSADSLDEDAETVLNFCLQATKKRRMELENRKASPSQADFFESNCNVDPLTTEDTQQSRSQLESRGQKVKEWLLHPKNDIEGREEVVHSEVNVSTTRTLMNCEAEAEASDPTSYFHLEQSRLLTVYLAVSPDPARNPLDLVSGYCRDGCQGISFYSAIQWRQDGPYDVPLCPDCAKIEKECELQLMFMMELQILDPTKGGHHNFVLVCRRPAEEFLNCTVAEYLCDPVIRESRCRLLQEYTLVNTCKSLFSPILDICVAPLDDKGHVLLLTDTYLKLPRP